MSCITDHQNEQIVRNSIAVNKLYLSRLFEDDDEGILITSIERGYETENRIPLKLDHSNNFGLLRLSYTGRKFQKYFPHNGIVTESEILLKKSTTDDNEFSSEDIKNDLHKGSWDIIHIITKKESDCHYLLKKAIEDDYTIILTIQFAIIDANNSLQILTLHPYNNDGTPLHRAVAEKDMKIIKTLLDYKLHVNARNKFGWTPLHVAVDLELSDVVDLLISNDANVYVGNREYRVPLHFAVTKSNSIILDSLLRRQEKLDVMDKNKQTPLHYAVNAGNADAVDILLKKGANYNLESFGSHTAFHLAVEKLNFDIIKVFLKNNVDADILNSFRRTPLFYASFHSQPNDVHKETYLNVIDVFLKKGANINFQDSKGYTPLYYAMLHNNNFMEALLEYNANVNTQDIYGKNVLHLACQLLKNKCVQTFLNCDIDINAVDNEGKTALHIAIEENNCDAVELILEKNPNINMADGNGRTALHLALGSRCLPIIGFLLKNQADVNLKDISGKTALHIASASPDITINIMKSILNSINDINAVDFNGMTALHVAIEENNCDAVELILEKNPNINMVDGNGRTALHLALGLKCLPIIELLLENKADVNLKDSFGKTALHNSLQIRNITINIIKSILNSTNDINAKDNLGGTAVHYAALNHNVNTLKYLLEESADVNAKDFKGKTPLHVTMNSKDNYFKCVEVLLDHKSDINAVDNNLVTPLHLACFIKNVEVVKYLIENGANSSMRDNDGRTVLHYTCLAQSNRIRCWFDDNIENDINDLLLVLLEKNISVNCVDNFGKTPLHYAAENDRVPVLNEILLNIGADINIVDKNNKSPFDELIEQSSYMDCDWSETLYKQHIVKMKILKLWVREKILDKIYEVDDDEDLQWIQPYEDCCGKEIDFMKSINLDESNITYYDFLKKSPHDAMNYTRNQNIVNAIQSDELMKMFPIYGHFFKNLLRNSQQRSYLYDRIQELLKPYIFKKLPTLCMNEVLRYLDHSELHILFEAMEFIA